MIFAPDDDPEGGNLVKDASDKTSSAGIVILSPSSPSRMRPGGHRKSETAITTAKKAHRARTDFELEARIEQIWGATGSKSIFWRRKSQNWSRRTDLRSRSSRMRRRAASRGLTRMVMIVRRTRTGSGRRGRSTPQLNHAG
jgi:hypothetical protein